jgi:hypothetical protein
MKVLDTLRSKDELKVAIRIADAPTGSASLVPANVFKAAYVAFLGALSAADKAANGPKMRSLFVVSHLKIGSSEFGLKERKRTAVAADAPAVELLQLCISEVYRSEYGRTLKYPEIARKIVAIGNALKPHVEIVAQFPREEIPIDAFFARQTKRLKRAMRPAEMDTPFFAGSAIGAFDGRLGTIDYRGAAWTGKLVLPESDCEIECVFDKAKGEDAFNPFGNKRVSVTGRAIYTGDGPLPERIEVIEIEEVPAVTSPVDVFGALEGAAVSDWGRGIGHLQ